MKLKLIPFEVVGAVLVKPAVMDPGTLRLSIAERQVQSFWAGDLTLPGLPRARHVYLISLLNDNTELKYAQWYVVQIPRKSKQYRDPQAVAIAAAKRLSEFRGWVGLQEYERWHPRSLGEVARWQNARHFSGPHDPAGDPQDLADVLRQSQGVPCNVAYIPRAKATSLQVQQPGVRWTLVEDPGLPPLDEDRFLDALADLLLVSIEEEVRQGARGASSRRR